MPAGAGFRTGTHELLMTVHSGDRVEVRYDADLFEPATVRRLLGHYRACQSRTSRCPC
jgi:hypothetical protein